MKHCIFCKVALTDEFEGNNAEPLRNGRCCNKCNAEIVIPVRLAAIINKCNKSAQSVIAKQRH
jgi:hypothetical protein